MQKHQIYIPFFLVSILIAIGSYNLNQNIIPHSKTEYRKALGKMNSSSFLVDIKEGQFFTSIPGVTLFAEKVFDGGKKMENVFIYSKKNEGVSKSIFAKKGEMLQIVDKKTKFERIRLVLEDGNIINKFESGKIEKIHFKNYNFPVGDKSLGFQFATKASMMTGSELKKYLDPKLKNKGYIEDLKKIQLEYWTRFNTPLQCIVFTLIGFVLGVRDTRGGRGNSVGKNLLVLFFYYAFFFYLVSLARKGNLSAPVAVFVPTMMMLGYGFYKFRKLDWNS